MRARGNRDTTNNTVNIHQQLSVLSSIFDTVMIVDPINREVLDVTEYGCNSTHDVCTESCPLSKDKCGCICKDTISTHEDRCRFVCTKTDAFLVISKYTKIRYRDCVMVLIMTIKPNFTFGSLSESEAIDTITKISSNLVIDPLTKIFNRKYLMDNIGHMMQEAAVNNSFLNLACIDIDNFKQFNDTYGHEFGDDVLKLVANKMKESIEVLQEAYPIRIGGDEFVIVAIGIDKNRFKAIMNKLCLMIDDSKLQYENKLVGVKISIGVSEMLTDHLESYTELYNKADAQLYAAKEAGKGCVR